MPTTRPGDDPSNGDPVLVLPVGAAPAPDLRFVDCRFRLDDKAWGRAQWRRARVPGAVFLDLEEDLSGSGEGRHPLPDPARLGRTLGAFGIGPETPLVVYDQGAGPYAARAWWVLRWLGHASVRVLDRGWSGWQADGRPVSDVPPETHVSTDYVPRPNRAAVVTPDEIPALAAAGALVDVREPDRFHGVREPIDRIAGHIPGARNLPWTQLLEPGGAWRDPEALRAQLVAERFDPTHAVWSCGSGVTACVGLLAAARAGLPGGRLYVGSWSGWISDPTRPIAVT
jgi:thiosulfate/3-mercaptopyruvate sulfurtransferase